MGAGRVLAVDTLPQRLEMARAQGAEAIDFNQDDPVQAIRELTLGAGVGGECGCQGRRSVDHRSLSAPTYGVPRRPRNAAQPDINDLQGGFFL
ncbi:MAG: hypothetical protein L0H63_00875 [Nitrococcus sp.]|nr:hypothetical protein [Nitrococcus sp.]